MFYFESSFARLLALVCLVWVLYEVWSVNKTLSQGQKILWTIGAIFFNIITAMLYYFIEKKKAI